MGYIGCVTKSKWAPDPYKCLINVFTKDSLKSNSMSRDDRMKSLKWVQISLKMARRCLIRHWINHMPPTVGKVETDLQYLFRLEKMDCELFHTTHSPSQRTFLRRWKDYIELQFSIHMQKWIENLFEYNKETLKTLHGL